jgi:large subunit ribosomal protein L5
MTLKERYQKEAIPALKEQFGYNNPMSVPRINKVSVNVGLGSNFKDSRYLEVVEDVLTRITGQKPVKNRARKSISNFRIREGHIIGMSVTLRGERMYQFLDKLVSVTLPRVRDFQGLRPKSVDHQGNIAIGFKDYLAFPEIRSDEVEILHGLEVSVATSATSREEGQALFAALGFPFKKS